MFFCSPIERREGKESASPPASVSKTSFYSSRASDSSIHTAFKSKKDVRDDFDPTKRQLFGSPIPSIGKRFDLARSLPDACPASGTDGGAGSGAHGTPIISTPLRRAAAASPPGTDNTVNSTSPGQPSRRWSCIPSPAASLQDSLPLHSPSAGSNWARNSTVATDRPPIMSPMATKKPRGARAALGLTVGQAPAKLSSPSKRAPRIGSPSPGGKTAALDLTARLGSPSPSGGKNAALGMVTKRRRKEAVMSPPRRATAGGRKPSRLGSAAKRQLWRGGGEAGAGGGDAEGDVDDDVFRSRGVGRDDAGNVGSSGLLGSFYGPASGSGL